MQKPVLIWRVFVFYTIQQISKPIFKLFPFSIFAVHKIYKDMNTINQNSRTFLIISMILIAAFARLIPHPWNFTPVAAMALFGGVYFRNKMMAFAVTILSLLLSDVLTITFINSSFTNVPQYLFSLGELSVLIGFIITVIIGIAVSRKTTPLTVIGASLLSSIIFFLITNLAVWNHDPLYPQNISGLISCYVAALPFFMNAIIGDLFYTGVLFGGFYLARLKFPVLAKG